MQKQKNNTKMTHWMIGTDCSSVHVGETKTKKNQQCPEKESALKKINVMRQ